MGLNTASTRRECINLGGWEWRSISQEKYQRPRIDKGEQRTSFPGTHTTRPLVIRHDVIPRLRGSSRKRRLRWRRRLIWNRSTKTSGRKLFHTRIFCNVRACRTAICGDKLLCSPRGGLTKQHSCNTFLLFKIAPKHTT